MLESMGPKIKIGNNTTICLEPDSKEETDRLFAGLSAGALDMMAPQSMFWGAYWGVCLDKYGIRWMFNYWNQ
jgi:PhnB protein